MREIKFRIWDKDKKEFISSNIYNFLNFETGELVDDCYLSVGFKYEISQYTGLKDKNEKEIYEGDILESAFCHPFQVYWVDRGYWSFFDNNYNNLYIVGNVYENPELLNG